MVGDYHRAISVLDTAIALNQYNYDQYILQGDGYLKMGDKDIARQKYDHARMLDPNRDEAYRRLEGL
jgi:Flp pilus assembly protein TadD